MNKIVARCTFACCVTAWLVFSFSSPWVLGDQNTFLARYIGSDLLSTLGVVISITLASATNINFELNKLQAGLAGAHFNRTRQAIRSSAGSLIVSWIAAFVVVVVKPLAGSSPLATSLMNGVGLLIVIFDAIVLADLTYTALAIVGVQKE